MLLFPKLRIENNKDALLIKSQTSLQLVYMFNHFDNDQNLAVDEIEVNCAKQSISNILPDLNLDDVTSEMKIKK